MDVTVRKATLQDFEAICRLYNQCDLLHHRERPQEFKHVEPSVRKRDYIEELIEGDDSCLHVATLNAEVVGLVDSRIKDFQHPLLVLESIGRILVIVVDEAYRNRGIGEVLLKQAHRWLRERGITDVELNAYAFNRAALRLYEKMGYSVKSHTLHRQLE